VADDGPIGADEFLAHRWAIEDCFRVICADPVKIPTPAVTNIPTRAAAESPARKLREIGRPLSGDAGSLAKMTRSGYPPSSSIISERRTSRRQIDPGLCHTLCRLDAGGTNNGSQFGRCGSQCAQALLQIPLEDTMTLDRRTAGKGMVPVNVGISLNAKRSLNALAAAPAPFADGGEPRLTVVVVEGD
jgi:hypothetical protein